MRLIDHNEDNICFDYEARRLARYSHIKTRVEYSENDFKTAYKLWSQTSNYSRSEMQIRHMRWNHYCDVRDNVPLGTNGIIEANVFKFKH